MAITTIFTYLLWTINIWRSLISYIATFTMKTLLIYIKSVFAYLSAKPQQLGDR
ncbi:hypothetical protein [Nostoc sp. DSM 114161]|uniref:hypothetical protein n=1 Tax=Nostoc sp. DSM 114161 TaxID=3440143 RepID=UPI00404644C9